MDQSLVLKPCVLDKLVKYFSERYLNSKDYLDRRKRIKWFMEKLSCNKIKQRQIKESDLEEIFSEIWAVGKKNVSSVIKHAKGEGLNSVLSKLEYLACREKWKEANEEVLKESMFKGFRYSRITELATHLYPDEFFIYNEPVRESLEKLINREIIKKINLPTNDKDFFAMYNDIHEIIKSILNIMRKYIRDANYLDVDAFLYDENSLTEETLDRAEKECSGEYSIEEEEIIQNQTKELILNALRSTKQVILYGVPGTGKTIIALKLAEKLAHKWDRVEFITFHSSYSYEEFVEGIRPRTGVEGSIEFYIEHGVFKKFVVRATCELIDCIIKNSNVSNIIQSGGLDCCKKILSEPKIVETSSELVDKALDEIYSFLQNIYSKLDRASIRKLIDKAPVYVLIIDEINRGDVAKIFGELVTLLESDKRLFEEKQIIVTLPYSKKKFFIPPNLYIIGTMNSADRSIALVDYALRRRFSFVELEPDPSKVPERIKTIDGSVLIDFNLRNFFIVLNNYLEKEIDRDHRIGHSYFMTVETVEDLRRIWFTQIRTLLTEYFYGRDDDLKKTLGDLYVKTYINEIHKFIESLKRALDTLAKQIESEKGLPSTTGSI